jgi:quercetin dioxygenase-like cupin family protein
MRVRLTKLDPGKEISWHIDYDPTYAVRIIVPIYTNDKVRNLFRVKTEEIDVNLEAGKAYFLNTGFAHAVFNKSNEPRIALMFSLDGQRDIDHLALEDSLEKA